MDGIRNGTPGVAREEVGWEEGVKFGAAGEPVVGGTAGEAV